MTLNLAKTSDEIGMPVMGQEGRKLGTVRDISLDLAAGSMEFLIVEAGGLLGRSGKYHPVPFRIARFDSIARAFQVNVHKDRFKESPSYDREQLSSDELRMGRAGRSLFCCIAPCRRGMNPPTPDACVSPGRA